MKSIGQANRLEFLLTSDVSVLSSSCIRLQAVILGSCLRLLCFSLQLNSFLSGKAQSLCLRSSTDWTRPTHIMEDSLLYSKSTSLHLIYSYKMSSKHHLGWCLIT